MVESLLHSSLLIKFVLLLLMGFSIFSWAIILYKTAQFRAASECARAMLGALQTARSSGDAASLLAAADQFQGCPLAKMVQRHTTALRGASKEDISRTLKQWLAQEMERLESYLIFLATTGSTTPFIGLFGTVWGILHAFQGIGTAGSASLAVVAPAIAEALIATAAGLAAAIPAVMAYNVFVNWTRKLGNGCEGFLEEYQELLMVKAKAR
ncbi:MAG: MotA/TolQ/ExbB proton channel family protein [Candidatus Omnitrophica bacterium]|nr:MotA/TolQ/ExbB proton channel family protein [Candidatus Omnitrophota bacterium]